MPGAEAWVGLPAAWMICLLLGCLSPAQLLIAGVPALLILTYNGVLPMLVSAEGADMGCFDAALLIAAAKVAVQLSRRRRLSVHAAHFAVLAYLGSCLVSTFLAHRAFGDAIFKAELVSLARLTSHAAVILLLPEAIADPGAFSRAVKLLEQLGYAMAGILLANALLAALGFVFGEVQQSSGITRVFGPFGDQASYLLTFFILRSIQAGRGKTALFFIFPLIATGTRAGLPILAIGGALMLQRGGRLRLPTPQFLLPILGLAGFLFSLIFLADIGGMRTRILNPSYLASTLSERLLSAQLAVDFFREHKIFGLGYEGLRFAVELDPRQVYLARISTESPEFAFFTAQNQWLQVLADGGLVGLGAFIGMVLVLLKTQRFVPTGASEEARALSSAGFAWLLGLILGVQTAVWLSPSSLVTYLIWVLLSLSIAARRIYLKPSKGDAQ